MRARALLLHLVGLGLALLALAACERATILCRSGCPTLLDAASMDSGAGDARLDDHGAIATDGMSTADTGAGDAGVVVDATLCGNQQRDPGETCDPPATCPTLCDDGYTCTADQLSGAAATCTAQCTHVATTACQGGDGCCPPGCAQAQDSDCPACGALDLRLAHTDVAVRVNPVLNGGGYGSGNRPLILAPRSDGTALVAWYGSDGQVQVTPLTSVGSRGGEDLSLPGDSVRGLVVHADGFAVLVVRGEVMVLARHEADGHVRWELPLTSSVDQLTEGDTWVDDWGHEGRLLWDGAGYVAYHGETRQFGAQGKHQGDQLVTISAAGQATGGGWWWGCSHSLDVRLAHNGTRLGPLCLSDCYPGPGVYFNHQTLVSTEEGNCQGSSTAALGGLAAVSDGFFASYAGVEGRQGKDVAMRFVPNSGELGEELWLTDTPGVDEGNIHLAAYGAHLLLLYQAQAGLTARVVRRDGTTVEGDVALAAAIAPFNDLVTMSDGDVAWVHPEGSALRVYRVAYCP